MMDAVRRRWIQDAVETYEARLVRYARLFTANVESARDAVQETFLRLCREDPERIAGHLGPWLFRVCRHRALDLCRKEGRMLSLDDPQPDRPDPAPTEDGDPGPDRFLDEQESLRHVLTAIGELTALQQEVLRLRFQQDLSYRDISEVTGRSVSHVGVVLHEAMKRLRQRLGEGVATRQGRGN